MRPGRGDALREILAGAGLMRGRRAVRAVVVTKTSSVAKSPDTLAATCVHLFERAKGGRRCKWCGDPPTGTRVRRAAGAPRIRQAVPEKDVQRSVIHLLCLAGCRYDPYGLHTDVYVNGTRRSRALPKSAHRTHQTPGIPDLFALLPLQPKYARVGCRAPSLVWIEVKAEDGIPSAAQSVFEVGCQARGVAHVMGGVDEVKAFLVRHGFIKEQKWAETPRRQGRQPCRRNSNSSKSGSTRWRTVRSTLSGASHACRASRRGTRT